MVNSPFKTRSSHLAIQLPSMTKVELVTKAASEVGKRMSHAMTLMMVIGITFSPLIAGNAS